MSCPDGSCTIPPQTRAEKRAQYEHSLDNAYDTYKGLRDDLLRIGHMFFDHSIGITGIEECLHDAWDELIYAATVVPIGHAECDRLVGLVVEVSKFGAFTRNNLAGEGKETAIMGNGQRLWTDLPYLVEDAQMFWQNEAMELGDVERERLACFMAKLSAVRACDVSGCALWLFRRVLEDDVPSTCSASLSQTALKDAEEDERVQLVKYLPACAAWFTHGNYTLARLCADNHCSERGVNSRQAGNDPAIKTTGVDTSETFSISRWLLWRKRLGDLYMAKRGKGGHADAIAKHARGAFEMMIGTGLAVGIDIPGEKIYLERVFMALDEELARREYKGCVEPKDIEIEPGWAE